MAQTPPAKQAHTEYCLYPHTLKVPELQRKRPKFQCLLKKDIYWLVSRCAPKVSLTVLTRLTTTELRQMGLDLFPSPIV